MGSERRKRFLRIWREWIRPLLIVVVVLCSFRSAVADWNDVPTGSMKPSIVEGDRIFVNKLAYGLRVPFTSWLIAEWSGPQRGDIVVFSSPADGKRLVKRVIGLPGDKIRLRKNRLFINGQAVEYEPLNAASGRLSASEKLTGHSHPIMITPAVRSKRSFAPIVVPEGQYFVMGDNRDESFDSRFFGCVERNRIAGQATMVVISVDPENHYWPRWKRFGHRLP